MESKILTRVFPGDFQRKSKKAKGGYQINDYFKSDGIKIDSYSINSFVRMRSLRIIKVPPVFHLSNITVMHTVTKFLDGELFDKFASVFNACKQREIVEVSRSFKLFGQGFRFGGNIKKIVLSGRVEETSNFVYVSPIKSGGKNVLTRNEHFFIDTEICNFDMEIRNLDTEISYYNEISCDKVTTSLNNPYGTSYKLNDDIIVIDDDDYHAPVDEIISKPTSSLKISTTETAETIEKLPVLRTEAPLIETDKSMTNIKRRANGESYTLPIKKSKIILGNKDSNTIVSKKSNVEKLKTTSPKKRGGSPLDTEPKRLKLDVKAPQEVKKHLSDQREITDNTNLEWRKYRARNPKEALQLVKSEWSVDHLSSPHLNLSHSFMQEEYNPIIKSNNNRTTSCLSVFDSKIQELSEEMRNINNRMNVLYRRVSAVYDRSRAYYNMNRDISTLRQEEKTLSNRYAAVIDARTETENLYKFYQTGCSDFVAEVPEVDRNMFDRYDRFYNR